MDKIRPGHEITRCLEYQYNENKGLLLVVMALTIRSKPWKEDIMVSLYSF